MATAQNLSEVLTQSKLTIVPFPAPKPIMEVELALLLSLRGRLHQLEAQVEAAEESKERERLFNGADE